MSDAPRCARCGSESLIPGCDVHSEGVTVVVRHPHRPRWMDPIYTESRVERADVCGACGFVMLLAARPDKLHEFWVKNGGSQQPRPE